MTESSERPYEERLAEVTDWIKAMGETDKVGDIDPETVKGVLEGMGAVTEISEEAKKSLAKYSNKGKRPGLDAVWGNDRVDAYKEWAKLVFIPEYEKKTGRELHTLWDPQKLEYDTTKHSGMMQFLGELTAFAYGQMPMSEYKRLTERRI